MWTLSRNFSQGEYCLPADIASPFSSYFASDRSHWVSLLGIAKVIQDPSRMRSRTPIRCFNGLVRLLVAAYEDQRICRDRSFDFEDPDLGETEISENVPLSIYFHQSWLRKALSINWLVMSLNSVFWSSNISCLYYAT